MMGNWQFLYWLHWSGVAMDAFVLCPRPGGEAREDERIARSRIEVSVRAVQKLKDNPKIKCNLW